MRNSSRFIIFAVPCIVGTTCVSANTSGLPYPARNITSELVTASPIDLLLPPLLLAQKAVDLLPDQLTTGRIRIDGRPKKNINKPLDLLPEKIRTQRINFTGIKTPSAKTNQIDLLPESIRTKMIRIGR